VKELIYNGRHLTVDARVYDRNFASLNDPTKCVELMEELVRVIDMTMILPPITVKFPHAVSEIDRIVQNFEAEGLGDSQTVKMLKETLLERKNGTYGYSTFVMIAESHLSIHTFPEEGFYTFDIYSCKCFPYEKVIEVLEQFFGPQKMSKNIIERHIPDFNESDFELIKKMGLD
jgi:S-adenosylmethionine decarboxylase